MTRLLPGRLADPAPATPTGALRLVSRRVGMVSAVWLLGVAAVAWAITAVQASSMHGMASGLGQIGMRAPMTTTAPIFLTMWLGMMTAMMFPTILPMVAAHRYVVRRRGEGIAPTVTFVAGYLLVWAVAGVVPLAVLVSFRGLSEQAGQSMWLPALGGAILIIAGAYQFTRWKGICLRACRSPLAFLMQHDFGGGSRSAVRAGISHGAYCLGCCWALMTVLIAVGLMNLVWMVALSLVFLVEKVSPHGTAVARVVGIGLLLVGAAVIAHPTLMHALAGTPDPSTMGM